MAIDLVARLNLEDNLSGPLGNIGSKMAGFVGFAALTAGATTAVKTFADFDSTMRKAATIAGATDSEFKKMSETAKQLGASTSLSSSEVADAMGEMAAKGYSAAEVMNSMPGVIAAAEASGEDLAVTADVVSTALNVWGMKASEASDVADVLAMTANATAAGIDDMQYALKYAGAPAKALGISLEEVAAAAGLMADSGIEGSTAGTALRQGLSMLISPTKQTKKAMDAVGFSATKTNGDVKSMVELVESLKESMKNMNDSERVSFMKDAVGTESMTAFLALVDAGPEKLAGLQKELENSGGAAQEAADKMKSGIGGALQEASGAVEKFMIEIGGALEGTVTKFAKFVQDFDTTRIVANVQKVADVASTMASTVIKNWGAISESVIAVTTAFVAFKAIMMTMTIINTVTTLLSALRAGTLLATAAQLGFNVALLANPIGLVVAGIAALIGVTVLVIRNWTKVSEVMSKAWYNISHGKGVLLTVLGPVGQLIKFAVQLGRNWDSTKSIWENVWTAMKTSAEDTVNTVINGINRMITLINKLPGVNIPVVAKVDWGDTGTGMGSVSNRTGASASTGTGQLLGNHAGISDVRGNTPRMLHDGERVLTKVENSVYKKALLGDSAALATIGGNGAGTTNATSAPSSVNVGGITINATVREEADIKKITDQMTAKLTDLLLY